MWNVFLSPDAQKFLEKQDKQVEKRLKKGLEKLKCDDPFHYLEHYEGHDYYKYRIGEYRALIDIDFANKTLKICVLDHRRIIYERKH